MKDVRSTVMQLSGRWGNTCYATLCLAVEAALDLPYGDVQMKHLWSLNVPVHKIKVMKMS